MKKILLLVDQTMKGKIDPALADWTVATVATDWDVEVVWCPRSEPGVSSWKEDVLQVAKKTREIYVSRPYDAILILGAVAKPYSGMDGSWNGNHFNGSCYRPGTVYGLPQIALNKFTDADKNTTAASGAPEPFRHHNLPSDGKFDISSIRQHPVSLQAFGPYGSLNESNTKVIPTGVIDASRLGYFGVSSHFTEVASDAEIVLISKALNRAVLWKTGNSVELPKRVIWDNAFDLNPNSFTKSIYNKFGNIEYIWSVGDNSGSAPKGAGFYKPLPSSYINAQTGGGWGGRGPYLNFGPWNSDPSRRVLDANAISIMHPKTYMWTIYGSYVQDNDATYSLTRTALLDPEGETINVNSVFTLPPGDNDTFADVFANLYTNMFKNVNNEVPAPTCILGDPTLKVSRPKTKVIVADFNGDKKVDFSDLMILSANYNKPGSISKGDSNLDGVVNFDDLLNVSARYNK